MGETLADKEDSFWSAYMTNKAKPILPPISAFIPGNPYVQKKREEVKIMELA